ncbi:uncharacterized protein LOC114974590 isoform X3 [Acropora millepora]|uniref:uncharacterized protein LOC114974590 isoform X3 n=1 Tax=Acropora millepora TaxID=45264 RepID=UPI001CF241F9|nr:uncharacterized protein LOC114974590 isoform X3 [Acropora millepora]
MRMALIPRFAFFFLLLLPYQCKAKGENCRETQCRLLPVVDVASDFRLKASKEGIRLVYINLSGIDNSRHDSLWLQEQFRPFLPYRWIWAHTASEPMLSLPEDYALLSASLVTYQVKNIDLELKDQPNGCLAKLNLTCYYLVVGRMLLENVTSITSSDILHKNTPVVCVAVMNFTSLWHQCCYVHEEVTGPPTIWCDKRTDVDDWVKIVKSIFLFLSFFLALFAPALPLALPDYVISLEDEYEKENHSAEQTNRETTGYQRITNPATLSPVTTFFLFIWNKISKRLPVNGRGLTVFCGGMYFSSVLVIVYFSLSLLTLSCVFVSSVVSYIIIGLALNATVVTPFLAFFLILATNVYSCYSKTQGKYKEVKKMIWTRLQELQLNNNVPKDTIRAELYWFVCDKVLPIKSEICRMLRNMVLVVAFLFLALSAIVFYGNEYDISTLTTTISVFFTGSIPLLFSKVLTTNSNIIGWAKIEMEGEIDKAITEYRNSSN